MISARNRDDTLMASAVGDILFGGRGDDFLHSDLGDTTLYGGLGDDTLTSQLALISDIHFEASETSGQYGGRGNDYMSVLAGPGSFHLSSIQSGGAGDDTIIGQAENVTVRGGSGDDMITQTVWNYACAATGGNLWIDGGSGNDTIEAALIGNDVNVGTAYIAGGRGADLITLNGPIEYSDTTIMGGAGDDTISANMRSRDSGNVDITVDGGAGNDVINVHANGTGMGGATVHLIGGGGHDHIETNPEAGWVRVTLEGGYGHDTLISTPITGSEGGRAEAELYGGAGHDHLVGSIRPGDISLNRWEDVTYTQVLDGGTGHDLIEATIGRIDAETSHPEAEFSAYNEVHGGWGHDTILVSGGHDNLLDGGRGRDLLRGSENADLIIGGMGADTLEGRSGDNTLSGGTGHDTFVFSTSDQGTTTITDWNRRQDRLDLDLTDLNGNGLWDELADLAAYTLSGEDGYLSLNPQTMIIFEGAHLWGDQLIDLFADPNGQII